MFSTLGLLGTREGLNAPFRVFLGHQVFAPRGCRRNIVSWWWKTTTGGVAISCRRSHGLLNGRSSVWSPMGSKPLRRLEI